jgi:hypothetical protein
MGLNATQHKEEINVRLSLIEQKQEFLDGQIEDIKECIKEMPLILESVKYLRDSIEDLKEMQDKDWVCHDEMKKSIEHIKVSEAKKTSKINLLWKALLFIIALGAGYLGNNILNHTIGNSNAGQIEKK